MYSSTFIFSKKQFDEEFHSRDKTIAEIARNIDGYLGEEAWDNPATGLVSNVYYWASLQALEKLIHDPVHPQAKANQAKWLNGYKVVIAQVIDIYGDERPGIISG
ncbi:antibiotic biosynthesis monooxygenase family protein [Advenella kashmirensis]